MSSSIATGIPGSQYIDGIWSEGSGPALEVVDPATEMSLASLPSSSDDDVELALAAARRAQLAWARTPAQVRGGHLRAIADLVAQHKPPLSQLLVKEVGKPAAHAAGEVDFAETILRYTAEWDRRIEGEILPGDTPGEVIHLLRAPIGVVAAICPWNYPLAVFFRKVAPALLTGNVVVAKPSEVSPLATIEIVRLIDEHLDLPSGVLNLVTGAAATGRALVRAELTSMVSFTGHRDTGKSIMAEAARNLTRVALELGGKAPAIVWKDADLDLAVSAIVEARHTNAGQVCTSAERVLVHRSVLQDFTDRYVGAVRSLTLGDPAGNVDMGPLVNADQFAKTETAVALAIAEGAQLLTGGGRPDGGEYERGYWFAPTVLHEVAPGMAVMTEETFGPVTPILGVESIDEALAIANDSRYGLSAYVFSRDYGTIMSAVDDLQFGEIYVNRSLGESVHAHHAGFKESGIGGEDGKWGVLRYTQIKTAYHHYG
jgi:lactaldehyde dehydrogenase / glycolaldehyde dehydrogenase